jgi:hypothetical protein
MNLQTLLVTYVLIFTKMPLYMLVGRQINIQLHMMQMGEQAHQLLKRLHLMLVKRSLLQNQLEQVMLSHIGYQILIQQTLHQEQLFQADGVHLL